MGKAIGVTTIVPYHLGALGTWIYLMFYDTNWTWWNWILVVPINVFLAEIWPIFWVLDWLRS